MTNWALLDGNTVTQVVVMEDGSTASHDWLVGNLGGTWMLAEHPVREAGIGMVYDGGRDAFYMPKPDDGNPNWFFNEETIQWELPKPVVEEIQLDPNWVAS